MLFEDAPRFQGLPADGFELFSIPSRHERRREILKRIHPALELLGELRLTPPRNYAIQARVKARPDAPADLTQGLMLVGPKLPDGSHEFQMTGSL